MALNLELKIQINSHDEIISKVLKNKGEFVHTLFQKDTYYDFKKGILKLREQNGKFELVKYNRNESEGERWSDYSLLFLNGDNVENYLNDIFNIITIIEKERKLYLYKNTRIHLDKVKNLGYFLELETVVNNISKDEALIEFNSIVNFLKLNLNDQIRNSYRDLMQNKLVKIKAP